MTAGLKSDEQSILKRCTCGGKPWFNLQSIQCLSCPKRIPKRYGNFADCAKAWNAMVGK